MDYWNSRWKFRRSKFKDLFFYIFDNYAFNPLVTLSTKEILIEIILGLIASFYLLSFFHILVESFVFVPISDFLHKVAIKTYSKVLTEEKVDVLKNEALTFKSFIKYRKEAFWMTIVIFTAGWNTINTSEKEVFSLSHFRLNFKKIAMSNIVLFFASIAISSFFYNWLNVPIPLMWLIIASGVVFFLLPALQYEYGKSRILILKTPTQRLIKSLRDFQFPIFNHFILRCILSTESLLPLRLVHFLNEMSRRHLLEFDGNLDTETGGGAWRWRHRIIQEYFLSNSNDAGTGKNEEH